MVLDQLLHTSIPWLTWSGLGIFLLAIVGFLTQWSWRFRLVGLGSFTLLLAVSCWAFSVSYSPKVKIEGAIRAPVVFDNGGDLVVAQGKINLESSTIEATLEQLSENLRLSGRGTSSVVVRLRGLETNNGRSRPIILGEKTRKLSK